MTEPKFSKDNISENDVVKWRRSDGILTAKGKALEVTDLHVVVEITLVPVGDYGRMAPRTRMPKKRKIKVKYNKIISVEKG